MYCKICHLFVITFKTQNDMIRKWNLYITVRQEGKDAGTHAERKEEKGTKA